MQLVASTILIAVLAAPQAAPKPSDLAREAHAHQVLMNHEEMIALVEPSPVRSLASAILERLSSEPPEIQSEQVETMFGMASIDEVRALPANVLIGRLFDAAFRRDASADEINLARDSRFELIEERAADDGRTAEVRYAVVYVHNDAEVHRVEKTMNFVQIDGRWFIDGALLAPIARSIGAGNTQ
jgi:hypothetical protein